MQPHLCRKPTDCRVCNELPRDRDILKASMVEYSETQSRKNPKLDPMGELAFAVAAAAAPLAATSTAIIRAKTENVIVIDALLSM